MALSEIEKLERRYAENPQGLTFAPLAEVHRKNGEVAARAGSARSGSRRSIPTTSRRASFSAAATWIWATCHAAETAFLHVLALDGENVIALKALADISERLLKFDEAERWLQTLLSVDRSNDDAREQLERVEIARRQARSRRALVRGCRAGRDPGRTRPQSGRAGGRADRRGDHRSGHRRRRSNSCRWRRRSCRRRSLRYLHRLPSKSWSSAAWTRTSTSRRPSVSRSKTSIW